MFNRTVEVKLSKAKKEPAEPIEEDVYLDRLAYFTAFVEKLIWDGAKLAAGYMVLDTIRKVAIIQASKGLS